MTNAIADSTLSALVEEGIITAGSPTLRAIGAILNSLDAPGSVSVYVSDIAAYLRFAHDRGEDPLADARDLVATYAADLRDRPYDGKRHYSLDTRKRRLTVLRRFYDELIERGIYAAGANPARSKTLKVKGERPPAQPALTAEEASDLLRASKRAAETAEPEDALRAYRDDLALRLLVFTGLRVFELASLRRNSRQTRGDYRVLEIVGKGDKVAHVKLTPELDEAIDAYLERADRAGIRITDSDPLFFGIGRGTPPAVRRVGSSIAPLTTRSLERTVDGALEGIGRDGRRTNAHLLRATSITLAYQASHDIELARKHARHANVATTVKNYVKPADELADAGIDYIKVRS